MLRAYIGLLGYGKTLFMARDVATALIQGRRVISNTPISFVYKGRKYEAEFIENAQLFLSRLIFDSKCLFAIDEAAITFPAYFWNKIPVDFLMKFAQARKYDCDFYYTTQGFAHSLARLRELTNEVYKCKPVQHFFLNYHYFRGYQAHVLDPEYYHSGAKPKEAKQFLIKSSPIRIYPTEARWLYKIYDTKKRVDSSLFGIEFGDLVRLSAELKIPVELLQQAKQMSYPYYLYGEDYVDSNGTNIVKDIRQKTLEQNALTNKNIIHKI